MQFLIRRPNITSKEWQFISRRNGNVATLKPLATYEQGCKFVFYVQLVFAWEVHGLNGEGQELRMQLDYQNSTSTSHFSVILLIFLHLLSYSNVVFVPVFLVFVLYVVGQFCVCKNKYIEGIRKWPDAWFFTFKAKRSRKPSRTVKMRNLLNIFLYGRENVDVTAETQHDKRFSWTVERCREVKSGQIEESDAVWELSRQGH